MFTRALIVLLLVLNLGVAAWWALRPAPSPPRPPQAPVDVAPLRLLAEVPVSARPPASPTPRVAAPVSDAPARCVAFGPFVDDAVLAAARAKLQAQGIRAQARPASTSGARGWRVWLPPHADRAAAQAMGARLAAAGFKDQYILTDGGEANAIALGRFGNEAAARRHQQALQAAGFPAEAEALGVAGGPRWLDAMVVATLDAEALRAAIGASQARSDCARPR